MYENKNQYDFSEYPENRPNFDMSNKKVLGKFKDELKSKIITEFVALKSKMYSFGFIDKTLIENKNKCEGVKKSVDLKHDEYKQSLFNEEIIYKEFCNLQFNKQNIHFDKINKIALNPFDSNRYWIDNINSVPYGFKFN